MRTVFASVRIRRINKTRTKSCFVAFVLSLGLWWPGGAPADADATTQHIALTKPPTAVVLSHDGRTLYVGLDRRNAVDGGIAVYRREEGSEFTKIAELPVAEGVLGVRLTSDERIVVASTPIGLVAVDAHSLEVGSRAMTAIRDGDAPGTNQLVISADNRYVFYTNAHAANLGIARLTSAKTADEAPALAIVGHILLDRVPGGLALSRDGGTLFIASEVGNVDPQTLPGANDPRLSRARCDINLGPSGVLSVVSVKLALRSPQRAVLARTAAGCSPVRVALAPDGDVVWVSDRGESRVLAFDVARLRRSQQALLTSVAVGNDPIGVAVSSDGRVVVVANSNHAPGSEGKLAGTLSLLDIGAVLHRSGSLPTTLRSGERPREIVAVPDGRFLVTDYDGRDIDIVTLPAAH